MKLTTVQFVRSILAVAVSVTDPALRDAVTGVVTFVFICLARVVLTYKRQTLHY